MPDTPHSAHDPWPRDLKIFALVCAVWSTGLIGRVVFSDNAYYPEGSVQAMVIGMKFSGPIARLVIVMQAIVIATFAVGISLEQKWALILALLCMLEFVTSHLIFMVAYMQDFTQGTNVRFSGLIGIIGVMVLLYLWIRSRDLLFRQHP
jgi:hypothetical protein